MDAGSPDTIVVDDRVCLFLHRARDEDSDRTGNMGANGKNSLFERLPGYALLRSLTQQLAGKTEDKTWKPALAEIEDALVPAFIIEELENRSFTVFVPSIPTPLAGAVYILTSDRVHPLDVPFTQAIKTISRWGSGSKDLLAAMKQEKGLI